MHLHILRVCLRLAVAEPQAKIRRAFLCRRGLLCALPFGLSRSCRLSGGPVRAFLFPSDRCMPLHLFSCPAASPGLYGHKEAPIPGSQKGSGPQKNDYKGLVVSPNRADTLRTCASTLLRPPLDVGIDSMIPDLIARSMAASLVSPSSISRASLV